MKIAKSSFAPVRRLLAGAALALSALPAAYAGSYPETVEEGFTPLFNGKDLTGWEGATAMYGVSEKEPGVLQCFPGRKLPKGMRGDLYTARPYTNFVLRFEFCMPPNGNNGLGIRMDPGKDAAYYGMCELQLLDDGGTQYYDAKAKKDKLKPYQYTGSIYGVVPSLRDNNGKQVGGKQKNFAKGGSYVRRPGMWNFEEVRVAGSEIEVYLNGTLVTKGDVSKFRGDGDTPDRRKHPGLHRKAGPIGWLGHGHNVKWQNIRIKELPADATMESISRPAPGKAPKGFAPYFTGKQADFANWKGVTTWKGLDNPEKRAKADAATLAKMRQIADDGMRAHWHVRNGSLFFDGFNGGYSLATARDFGDFEMWADWRLMSITGDSGVYLRGSPQVQIWDAWHQWHIGSGGLYNNQKNPSKALSIADRPVGDWNRFYIRMKGEKVTVRLNGVTVVDDVTLENYWNRKIPIFPSGQIELQCHGDPIEWRNIYLRPLEPAKVEPGRIGVCSWSYRLPIDGVAAEMKKSGVKGIHLALGPFVAPDERHGAAEGAETLKRVKERIASGEWKLMSTMIGFPQEDYSTLESIRRTGGIVPDGCWEKNKRLVSEAARLTRELGAPYLSTHAGFLDESDPAAYAKFVERVSWMRDECARHGVQLILESGQETAADLEKFMKSVPGVGINFDPANMILYGKGDPVSAVKTLLPWIRQVHVKDALFTRRPGTWGEETPWGEGAVGGAAFIDDMVALGYKGNFVIEREGGSSRIADIALAQERLEKGK